MGYLRQRVRSAGRVRMSETVASTQESSPMQRLDMAEREPRERTVLGGGSAGPARCADIAEKPRKKIRPSERARLDFEFFSATGLDMVGHEIGVKNTTDPDGYTALECWYAKDTHGQTLPCSEPEKLAKALRGKASWNLQVKMWAENVAGCSKHPILQGGLLLGQEELMEYCHGRPEWVFDATMKQAAKIYREEHYEGEEAKWGWTPKFVTLVRVFGQWWPPYMHDWSPTI